MTRRPIFLLAPWRRAPLLIWRQPAAAAAVFAAMTVLAATGAAFPLFISSAGSAAVGIQTAQRCGPLAGLRLTGEEPVNTVVPLLASVDTQVNRALAASHAARGDLQAPVVTVLGGTYTATPGPAAEAEPLQLVSRTGFGSQISVLSSRPGPGLWVPDSYAAYGGLRPGSKLLIGPDRIAVPVAGIYRDLEGKVQTPYWCSLTDVLGAPDLSQPPPSTALVDQASLLALVARLSPDLVGMRFERSPRPGSLPLSEARRLVAAEVQMINGTIQSANPYPDSPYYIQLQPGQLRFVADRAASIQGATRSAVLPIVAGGLGVASLLVAAAGSYWVDRRRTEVDLLASRGVGPGWIGLKALLETIGPVLGGTAAGWAAAWAGIQLVGPASRLDRGSTAAALIPAAACGVGGAALLGLAASIRSRARSERTLGRRAPWWAGVPWEVALIAAGLAVMASAPASGTRPGEAGSVPRIPGVFLAFPPLVTAGSALLLVRMTLIGAMRWRRRPAPAGSGPRPPYATASFLAVRRLVASRVPASLLVLATAASIGTVVYAGVLSKSEDSTLRAKASTFIGGDVSVLMSGSVRIPPSLAGSATVVDLYGRYETSMLDGQSVPVLAVDPATFLRGVNPAALPPGCSCLSLIHALSHNLRPGQPVPALLVGRVPRGGTLTMTYAGAGVTLPLSVLDHVPTFPGVNGQSGLVVVPRGAVPANGPAAATEVWARGTESGVVAELEAAGNTAVFANDAGAVLDLTDFAAVTWTFGYLQSLGVVTGLITVGGLLLYLESRQRARNLGYVMARAMGLSRLVHTLSLAVEVGSLLLLGSVAGAGMAMVSAWVIHSKADPLPVDPPSPLLVVPLLLIVTAVTAAAVVTAVAVLTAQRAADRASPAVLLREAD